MEFFTPYLEQFTYLGILIILLAAGLGLPVSEDLVLITCGFLAYNGIIRFLLSIPICIVGVISGDLILYAYGRRYGQNILQKPMIKRILRPRRIRKVQLFFGRHGNKTIFLARHFPILRATTFLVAGTMKVKPVNFILMDGLGALLTVPLFTSLGYLFANHLDMLKKGLTHLEHLAVVVVFVVIILVIIKQNYTSR